MSVCVTDMHPLQKKKKNSSLAHTCALVHLCVYRWTCTTTDVPQSTIITKNNHIPKKTNYFFFAQNMSIRRKAYLFNWTTVATLYKSILGKTGGSDRFWSAQYVRSKSAHLVISDRHTNTTMLCIAREPNLNWKHTYLALCWLEPVWYG